MSTVKANYFQHPSSTVANLTLNSDGSVSGGIPAGGRNRIINGACVVSQRLGTTEKNPVVAGDYTVDRFQYYGPVASKFKVQQNAASVTPPTYFKNYLGLTVTNAYTPGSYEYFTIGQAIEGYNVADLAWGTANAQQITLSFWVRSSVTGTHSGSLQNSAQDRSYVFSYTISAANTWEKKSVTIAGDTTGTWLTDNGIGIRVFWNLGSDNTNRTGAAGVWGSTPYFQATGAVQVVANASATFYLTGVQLEVGPVATPFEFESYGDTLRKCQRYYTVIANGATSSAASVMSIAAFSTTAIYGAIKLPVEMRTTPSNASTSGTGYFNFLRDTGSDAFDALVLEGTSSTKYVVEFYANSGLSGQTSGMGGWIRLNSANALVAVSAEL